VQRPLWYKDQIADAEKTALHVNRSIKQYKYDERQMVADPIEAMEVVCENFHATNWNDQSSSNKLMECSKLLQRFTRFMIKMDEVN